STTTSLVLPAQNYISHNPDSINQIHHTCSLHPVFKTHITPCLFARYLLQLPWSCLLRTTFPITRTQSTKFTTPAHSILYLRH
ncbi:hypothetical protein UPYG_G00086810, partial [Umbra pygmaea]